MEDIYALLYYKQNSIITARLPGFDSWLQYLPLCVCLYP